MHLLFDRLLETRTAVFFSLPQLIMLIELNIFYCLKWHVVPCNIAVTLYT